MTMERRSASPSKWSTIWLASSVMVLSRSLRVSLYWLIWLAFSNAAEKSFSMSSSTASFPFCIRPDALMRGPILNTISPTVISFSDNPHTSIIAFRPVSYTHLDVYKRQVVCFDHCQYFISGFTQ